VPSPAVYLQPAAATEGSRRSGRVEDSVRCTDDFGVAAPYEALAVAGTHGVFLEVGPSEHAVA
jgi:hypothetical protein